MQNAGKTWLTVFVSDPYTLTKIFEVNETRIFLSEFQSEAIVREYTIQCFLGITVSHLFFWLKSVSAHFKVNYLKQNAPHSHLSILIP